MRKLMWPEHRGCEGADAGDEVSGLRQGSYLEESGFYSP